MEAILLYVEKRIPRSRCAIVSNTARVVRAISEGVERAKRCYQHKPFRWQVAVGDVANIYDELDHGSVDIAIIDGRDNVTWHATRPRDIPGGRDNVT